MKGLAECSNVSVNEAWVDTAAWGGVGAGADVGVGDDEVVERGLDAGAEACHTVAQEARTERVEIVELEQHFVTPLQSPAKCELLVETEKVAGEVPRRRARISYGRPAGRYDLI